MSNWEEIEKQVKGYGFAYHRDSECGMADCLDNIKGIVDAMESQIPKECSHGVSMTEICTDCMLDKETPPADGEWTIYKEKLQNITERVAELESYKAHTRGVIEDRFKKLEQHCFPGGLR